MSEAESSFVALTVDLSSKMTPDLRRAHCENWHKNGLSMSEYCRRCGLHVSSLSGWAKKFNYTLTAQCKNKTRKMLAPPPVPHKRQCMEIIPVSGICLRFSKLEKIQAPPESALGRTVTYCLNQRLYLCRYVDRGEIEISNCWIENQIRPFALGRRNWLCVLRRRFHDEIIKAA